MRAWLSINYPAKKYCTPSFDKKKLFLTGEKIWKFSGLHVRVTNQQSKITRQAGGTWLL